MVIISPLWAPLYLNLGSDDESCVGCHAISWEGPVRLSNLGTHVGHLSKAQNLKRLTIGTQATLRQTFWKPFHPSFCRLPRYHDILPCKDPCGTHFLPTKNFKLAICWKQENVRSINLGSHIFQGKLIKISIQLSGIKWPHLVRL